MKLVPIHLKISATSFASFAKSIANFPVKIISYPQKHAKQKAIKKKTLAPKLAAHTFCTASKKRRYLLLIKF
ncbi:hypothetical protein C7N43_16045 [Sphingobacteriales bacterium UPWRP_1]|nr:hypothetical protein C7N43_16045 [Sphingobacteriales bacterium UPWRP_1]